MQRFVNPAAAVLACKLALRSPVGAGWSIEDTSSIFPTVSLIPIARFAVRVRITLDVLKSRNRQRWCLWWDVGGRSTWVGDARSVLEVLDPHGGQCASALDCK